MKLPYKLSLSLSVLLVLMTSLPSLSISTQSNSPGNSRLSNNERVILASSRPKWRRTRAPRWRIFGARRGSCLNNKTEFIPLVPPDPDQVGSNQGFTYHNSLWNTASPYPTVFFYLPEAGVTHGELSVENQDGEKIYTASLKLPDQAGIVSVKLPQFSQDGEIVPPLDVGQTYRWIISVNCQDVNSNVKPEVGGGIYRVDPETTPSDVESEDLSVTLEQALAQAQTEDLPTIYQQANIWYNSLSSLAELIESQPNNPDLKQEWHDLFVDVGYDDSIANLTVIQSADILDVDLSPDQ